MRLLFDELDKLQYDWQPQTPDQLLSHRKNPQALTALTQLFGLGLGVSNQALQGEGFDSMIWGDVLTQRKGLIYSPVAISKVAEHFVLHSHWPPVAGHERDYVHLGHESQQLIDILSTQTDSFSEKAVLDLGCSSGALTFAVAKFAKRVTGFDISKPSIELAKLTAEAYGYKNLFFQTNDVTQDPSKANIEKADIAIMNPPMVVPSKDAAYPHRDGGKLGVEIPLQFLDFCHHHLKPEGRVHTLATNPIVNGKNFFFDELDEKKWVVKEKKRLHSQFNQAVAAKEKYQAQGIERIELWYVSLQKP